MQPASPSAYVSASLSVTIMNKLKKINLKKMKIKNKNKKLEKVGCLGGSVVKHLPSAQGMILEYRDRVPRQAPCMQPASLPVLCLCLCPSLSFSLSLCHK